MTEATAKFSCEGCGRSYVWKKELAGKKAKCKGCGHVITIPAEAWKADPVEDDLYAVNEPPPVSRPKPIKAPPLAAPVISASEGGAGALEYDGGPTPRQRERDASGVFVQMPRDRYTPAGMIVVGALLFLSYYATRSPLGIGAMGLMAAVLTGLAAVQTGILVGFALAIAGPMDVSFGTLWTAVLKLAAIVVFCDGISAWVGGVGGGQFSVGFYGISVVALLSLVIYWVSMTYLFEMDPYDSWLVVLILGIVYRLLSLALIFAILWWIGRSSNVPPSLRTTPFYTPPPTGPPPPPPSVTMQLYARAGKRGQLVDATKWAAQQKMTVEPDFIKSWYASGAKNVQFQIVPVGIGHTGVILIFVQLPADPLARAKCYSIAKSYYAKIGLTFLPPALLRDTGDDYLAVEMPPPTY